MDNRLRELRNRQGLSLERLGEALGVHWQTVQRWETGKTEFGPRQAEKVAPILGVAPTELFVAPPRGRIVPVTCVLQAGVWREAAELPLSMQYDVVIPQLPGFETAVLYAGEVAGESMNRVFPAGSIVVMAREIHDRHSLIAGKRYHVEIQRRDGTVESTLKTLRKDAKDRWWLVPESSDPEFAQMLLADLPGEHVSVVGRVVWSIREE